MKKAKQPILYVLSSLSSWALDTGVFYLAEKLFGTLFGGAAELICNFIARACSSFFNFNLNRFVFESKEDYGKSMLRYYLLAIPQLIASTVLLILFTRLFHVESSEGKTLVKIIVDGTLFVISFYIQKFWVFAKKK
jgi:putative flippase GtrA